MESGEIIATQPISLGTSSFFNLSGKDKPLVELSLKKFKVRRANNNLGNPSSSSV